MATLRLSNDWLNYAAQNGSPYSNYGGGSSNNAYVQPEGQGMDSTIHSDNDYKSILEKINEESGMKKEGDRWVPSDNYDEKKRDNLLYNMAVGLAEQDNSGHNQNDLDTKQLIDKHLLKLQGVDDTTARNFADTNTNVGLNFIEGTPLGMVSSGFDILRNAVDMIGHENDDVTRDRQDKINKDLGTFGLSALSAIPGVAGLGNLAAQSAFGASLGGSKGIGAITDLNSQQDKFHESGIRTSNDIRSNLGFDEGIGTKIGDAMNAYNEKIGSGLDAVTDAVGHGVGALTKSTEARDNIINAFDKNSMAILPSIAEDMALVAATPFTGGASDAILAGKVLAENGRELEKGITGKDRLTGVKLDPGEQGLALAGAIAPAVLAGIPAAAGKLASSKVGQAAKEQLKGLKGIVSVDTGEEAAKVAGKHMAETGEDAVEYAGKHIADNGEDIVEKTAGQHIAEKTEPTEVTGKHIGEPSNNTSPTMTNRQAKASVRLREALQRRQEAEEDLEKLYLLREQRAEAKANGDQWLVRRENANLRYGNQRVIEQDAALEKDIAQKEKELSKLQQKETKAEDKYAKAQEQQPQQNNINKTKVEPQHANAETEPILETEGKHVKTIEEEIPTEAKGINAVQHGKPEVTPSNVKIGNQYANANVSYLPGMESVVQTVLPTEGITGRIGKGIKNAISNKTGAQVVTEPATAAGKKIANQAEKKAAKEVEQEVGKSTVEKSTNAFEDLFNGKTPLSSKEAIDVVDQIKSIAGTTTKKGKFKLNADAPEKIAEYVQRPEFQEYVTKLRMVSPNDAEAINSLVQNIANKSGKKAAKSIQKNITDAYNLGGKAGKNVQTGMEAIGPKAYKGMSTAGTIPRKVAELGKGLARNAVPAVAGMYLASGADNNGYLNLFPGQDSANLSGILGTALLTGLGRKAGSKALSKAALRKGSNLSLTGAIRQPKLNSKGNPTRLSQRFNGLGSTSSGGAYDLIRAAEIMNNNANTTGWLPLGDKQDQQGKNKMTKDALINYLMYQSGEIEKAKGKQKIDKQNATNKMKLDLGVA